MRGKLATWAKAHLKRADNLAGLCHFLASPFGAPLRSDGLLWIKAALEAPNAAIGFHRNGSGDALVDLILTILQNDVAAMRKRVHAPRCSTLLRPWRPRAARTRSPSKTGCAQH